MNDCLPFFLNNDKVVVRFVLFVFPLLFEQIFDAVEPE